MTVTNSPQKAPKFASHREGVTASETAGLASIPKEYGMNFNGHDWALFSVRPSGGANPDVKVAAWDGEGWARLTETEATQSGAGVNIPYQFSIRASGRILLVFVDAIAAGSVDVRAAGWDAHGGAG